MSRGAGSPDAASLLRDVSATEDPIQRGRQVEALADRFSPTPQFICELCDEVHRLLRKDLRLAGRGAEAVRQLAERLGDPGSRARSHRTLANVLHRQGSYRQAMAEFECALELFARADQETEVAATRSTAIHNLIYLGDYPRAFDWAERARVVFERHGDRLRLARLRLNHANILFRQDRWDEAARDYETAYRELREVGGPEEVAVSLRTLAVCRLFLNDFSGALSSYQAARDLCRQHGLAVLGLENDYNIAYLYFQRGEYRHALQVYKEVRRRSEQLGDREHMALCDLDQAEIYLELNLVDEAAELGQSAFDQFQALEMPYEAAKAVTNLAISRSRQGKAFLALDLLDQARAIFESERNLVWKAQIDLYQALVYYSEERLVEGTARAQRALEEFTALCIPNKVALCNILLARLALHRGKLETARGHCDLALAGLKALNFPALDYQASFVQGQIEEAAGHRERALAAFRRTRERLDRLRSHLQTDELKITFLEDKLMVFERLVGLLMEQPSAENQREAFACIERAKSRSLSDLMAFRAHSLPAKSTARSNLVTRIRNLREELNWYYRSIDLHEMHADQASRARLEALHQESRQRESSLVRTLRELQSTDLEYSSLQSASALGLEEIRKSLAPEARILELYIAREVVYGCVLGPDRLKIEPLTVASRVLELYRLLQFQLSKHLLGADYVEQFRELVDEASLGHLQGLFDELLAPVEELLDGKHLVIVPHGFLHHVPFHALHDGDRHLIDRCSISYAPSASVYSLCRNKRPEPAQGTLVLGIADRNAPHNLEQAQAVAEAVPGSTLLLDEQATEERLRRLGRQAQVLHIATHGVFRHDNPMFSAIQLGDTRLSLFDLYGLHLNADLVVLTGCGTGLTAVKGADELVGLARGILYAGARAVLVTLWDAKGPSTASFMRAFHRRRASQASTAQALRETMLELRSSHPHPYFWAPFLLVGSPD